MRVGFRSRFGVRAGIRSCVRAGNRGLGCRCGLRVSAGIRFKFDFRAGFCFWFGVRAGILFWGPFGVGAGSRCRVGTFGGSGRLCGLSRRSGVRPGFRSRVRAGNRCRFGISGSGVGLDGRCVLSAFGCSCSSGGLDRAAGRAAGLRAGSGSSARVLGLLAGLAVGQGAGLAAVGLLASVAGLVFGLAAGIDLAIGLLAGLRLRGGFVNLFSGVIGASPLSGPVLGRRAISLGRIGCGRRHRRFSAEASRDGLRRAGHSVLRGRSADTVGCRRLGRLDRVGLLRPLGLDGAVGLGVNGRRPGGLLHGSLLGVGTVLR